MRIALFITCLTDQFLPRAGVAATLVLEALGHTVDFPPLQTCCGQPMFNNGAHGEARDLARRFALVFEAYEHIVTPSGSCAAMVRRHFPHLCPDEHRVLNVARRTREFCEFLTSELGIGAHEIRRRCVRPLRTSVAVHTSCHQRSLGLLNQADSLLSGIAGLEAVAMDHDDQCCGFGGTFAVKQPELSAAMVGDKVRSIQRAGADQLVSGDAGCLLNIAGACRHAGISVRPQSAAELIAESWGLIEPEHTP